jgi:hypothetical protein
VAHPDSLDWASEPVPSALAVPVPHPAFGQSFEAGVKVGVPATPFFETGAIGAVHGGTQDSSGTRRYTIGASAEWHLTRNFGFELDAMYHRLGYTTTVTEVNASNFSRAVLHVTGNAWDFPVLVKYRFGRVLRPYAAAGGTLRYIASGQGQGEQTSLGFPSDVTTVIQTSSPSDLNKRIYPGLTASGGLEFNLGRLHLLPELRYTRWTANISGPAGTLRFAPNQVEFLLGLNL